MILPAVALRGVTVLPKMLMHFNVTRPKSIAAVERAMVEDQRIFLILQSDEGVEDPQEQDLFRTGTICTIRQLVRAQENVTRVLVEGKVRAELVRLRYDLTYLAAEITECDFESPEPDVIAQEAMLREAKDAAAKFAKAQPGFADTAKQLEHIGNLKEYMEQLMIRLPLPYLDRQKLLEAESFAELYGQLMQRLMHETRVVNVQHDIQEKLRERLDKNQREYVLREQLRVIRQELGEDENAENARMEEELAKLKAPAQIKEKIERELARVKAMPTGSHEAAVNRKYIETLLDIPWQKMSGENKDITKAAKILNEDHYGLEKVKDRILEHLAVRSFSGKNDGTILCLTGPPGTGKTSIAKSIARCLDRQYVRVCLGGVRDEAEIRGHRRTYVSAMPGRIVAGMRQAGVSNPVMLLDEIDKISTDYKGDTFSAMLEVLDPEQNAHFRDHYIELPLDLSNVMFIATANTTATIPMPLLDRMEVIEVTSYTDNEKFHIAKDYLIPKQMQKNGLLEKQLKITDAALKKVISNYTREAGVRNLERTIGEICRKAARRMLEQGEESVTVDKASLEGLLGKEHIRRDMANDSPQVGVVCGLAWTSVGGDILQIEVNIMAGEGRLVLTGMMGDVMKESATAAETYVRSVAQNWGIDRDFFSKHEIHLHIPQGAVPKDGPSAGVTMAVAILSAASKKPVRADIAMTGEITLRGRVLPVGGLKEKLLAAKRAGIKAVFVPEKNKPDVAELSSEITDGLEIIFVSDMEDITKACFA